MWGSWYLLRFLFNGGESLTLMYMASLVVLVMPCDFLPTMEKLSSLMMCPAVLEWSKMEEGALRCSLYLSPTFLPVSPMYSMVHPGCPHVSLCNSPFLQMLSLSFRATNNSLTVLVPLKGTCTPTFPHMFLKLALSPLEYGTTAKMFFFICVPVEVDVIVPLLLTELEVHFCSEPVENAFRVVAPAECHMEVLVFLFQ